MCRLPVTLGGGMTMQKGSAPRPLGPAGAKSARRFPKRGDALFDVGGLEGLFHRFLLFAPAAGLFCGAEGFNWRAAA